MAWAAMPCEQVKKPDPQSRAPYHTPPQSPMGPVDGTHLFNGADGDTCSTGHHNVPVLDVSTNFVQDEGDDVWLHRQEEHIAVVHCLFVVGGQVHPYLLRECKGLSLPHGPSTHKAESPEPREAQRLLGCGASWVGGQNPLSCPYPDMEKALGSGMFPFEAKKPSKPQLSPSYLRL